MKQYNPLKNNRGVAILIAVFSMTLLVFLAMEVGYETQVEYVVAAQGVNRLKARYAAKAGAEISLLRVLLYKKALASFGDQLKNMPGGKSALDPIWNFPFAWPPSAFLPDDISAVDREQIDSAQAESLMEAQYVTNIQSEGSKLDVNDLGSASEALAKSTHAQILSILDSAVESNEEFGEKYRSYNFERLVNNMADWVDEDNEGRNGGDERSVYRDVNNDFIPPNEGFKTLEELHMVADMTDDIYQLLAPRLTVHGTKGININYASAEMLMSLDPQITEEISKMIIERRDDPQKGGPFSGSDDFYSYIENLGVRIDSFNQPGIPLLFGEELNFRIVSTGSFANAVREITVVTYDFDSLKERYIEMLEDEDKQTSQGQTGQGAEKGGQQPDSTKKKEPKKKVPSGRPTIVYWNES